MTGTELTRHDHGSVLPSAAEVQTMLTLANAFVKSGLLPNAIKTPEAALLIIQKGKELGLQPTYALSNIAVIQGKPVAGSELLAALIYRDHGDNALRVTETNDQRCVIDYRRKTWASTATFSFSIEDAKRANLTGKDNWKHFPAAMLRARCISAVARMAFPDSIGGMYTPEELGAEVTVDYEGAVTVVQPEPARLGAAPTEPEYTDADVVTHEEETPVTGRNAAQESFIANESLRTESSQQAKPGSSPTGDIKAAQINAITRMCNELGLPVPADLETWTFIRAATAIGELSEQKKRQTA